MKNVTILNFWESVPGAVHIKRGPGMVHKEWKCGVFTKKPEVILSCPENPSSTTCRSWVEKRRALPCSPHARQLLGAPSTLPAAWLLPRWRRPRPARAVSRSPSYDGGVYDRGGAGRERRGWRQPGAGAAAGVERAG